MYAKVMKTYKGLVWILKKKEKNELLYIPMASLYNPHYKCIRTYEFITEECS